MATATIKNRCVVCGKEKASVKCEGCSRTFCYNHMTDHRQELSKQLDEIEVTRDLFRQTLTEQSTEPRKHPLIQQIDQWERQSIDKIRQTADKARQLLLTHTTSHVTKIEVKLGKLTDQLRQNREESDFVETDLNHWKDELTRLTKEFAEPPNISIRQDTTSLVTNILVDVHSRYISCARKEIVADL
jgi:chromosome segregation ATPase